MKKEIKWQKTIERIMKRWEKYHDMEKLLPYEIAVLNIIWMTDEERAEYRNQMNLTPPVSCSCME